MVILDSIKRVLDNTDCGLYICAYLNMHFRIAEDGLRPQKITFADKELFKD